MKSFRFVGREVESAAGGLSGAISVFLVGGGEVRSGSKCLSGVTDRVGGGWPRNRPVKKRERLRGNGGACRWRRKQALSHGRGGRRHRAAVAGCLPETVRQLRPLLGVPDALLRLEREGAGSWGPSAQRQRQGSLLRREAVRKGGSFNSNG